MNKPKGKNAWTVKIGEKGQFVIPKEAREMFGLHPGDTILVLGDIEKEIAIPPKSMMDKYISMISGEMSMGENISVFESVDQIAVLSAADVFLSHCGMNSVSESLYYQVPLIMHPLTSEQKGGAARTAQLGAGLLLKKESPADKILKACAV